jgi:hypothetical protein
MQEITTESSRSPSWFKGVVDPGSLLLLLKRRSYDLPIRDTSLALGEGSQPTVFPLKNGMGVANER